MRNQEKELKSVVNIPVHEELQSSFLDYAVSVIISRAIPDVRDGLKPVHRRVLYSMQELSYTYNRPYRKSVGVVGEVLKNYHPHGDQAVYETMVGMVQDFARRYPLLDGQGNWGSVDGDNAAAMRYTEVRMQRMCQEILADINKDTVPFVPNFDESTIEPTVLPSRIPNLLINGTSGIAVGMATSIPPHNLNEVIDGAVALLHNDAITNNELMNHIKGPDFPTGGIICGRNGIIKAYNEGRGTITVRGIVEIEETAKGGQAIVITQIPYLIVKSDLIIKIAELVRDKIVEGISNIRDESNKQGMRIFIELKRDAHPDTVLNLLYKHTSLQNNFSINLLALLHNKPQVFTLKSSLQAFLNHRRDVITRRTIFERNKAKAQEHILAGLQKITDNVKLTIELISQAESPDAAAELLVNQFGLSPEQVRAVLDLRLQRLTSLERKQIAHDRTELLSFIDRLETLLNNPLEINKEIERELIEVKTMYGDERKTVIQDTMLGDFDPSAFVTDEEVVITLTKKGYIKRVALTTYDIQHRGGKGKMGTASLEESDDIIQDLFIAKNHDTLLFFTNLGRVYTKQVYELPEVSRTAKGRAIINILPLQPNESVINLLCARNLEGLFIMMITTMGTVKRVATSEFENIRQTGIRAITLNEGDTLAFCGLTTGKDSVVVATKKGMGIRFKEIEVRSMGRQAAGVRAIKLSPKDEVIGVQVVQEGRDILFVTEHGFGKRVKAHDFRIAHRGGKGVRTIPTNKRNGCVIGLGMVDDETDIILIDGNGKVIRISPDEVRTMGRQAQGVRLIRLDDKQTVAAIAVIKGDEQAEAQYRKLNSTEEPVSEILEMIDTDVQEDADINDIDHMEDDTETETDELDSNI
jgi:DNA gyrase subunit A